MENSPKLFILTCSVWLFFHQCHQQHLVLPNFLINGKQLVITQHLFVVLICFPLITRTVKHLSNVHWPIVFLLFRKMSVHTCCLFSYWFWPLLNCRCSGDGGVEQKRKKCRCSLCILNINIWLVTNILQIYFLTLWNSYSLFMAFFDEQFLTS